MKSTVEDLVRQLAALQDQLIALPDDAFAERFELVSRQDEMRALAAQHAQGVDIERSTEDLLGELAGLRSQRDALNGEHAGTILHVVKAGAAGLPDHADTDSVNRRSDPAQDMLRIEGRIGRIGDILIDRGVDPA